MAIPNLSLRTGYQFTAQGTGIPDNGNNTFSLPWGSQQGLSASGDEIELDVISNGSSVIDATFVSFTRNSNDSTIVLNVTQTGSDTVTVIAQYVHSLVR